MTTATRVTSSGVDRSVRTGEVNFATGRAGATNTAHVRETRTLERDERELDEGVTGELLNLAKRETTRSFAVTLERCVGFLLEANEVGRQQPIDEREALAGCEAESGDEGRATLTSNACPREATPTTAKTAAAKSPLMRPRRIKPSTTVRMADGVLGCLSRPLMTTSAASARSRPERSSTSPAGTSIPVGAPPAMIW